MPSSPTVGAGRRHLAPRRRRRLRTRAGRRRRAPDGPRRDRRPRQPRRRGHRRERDRLVQPRGAGGDGVDPDGDLRVDPGRGSPPCPCAASSRDFTLVHGSPRDPTWEYVTSAALARAGLSAISTEHGLHGHTHVPIAFTEVDGRMRTLAPRAGNTVALGEGRMLPQPGQRRPAARRRPAGELPGPRPRRPGPRPGAGSPTTSRPSVRSMRAAGPADAARRSVARRRLTAGHDRRPTPAPGSQAGRPARPRRAPARAVLPLHRPGPPDGQGGGQRARRPRPARAFATIRGVLLRPAAGERGRARRAAVARRRRWRSSAPTPSARRPTRPRRSCAS